jgi:hypothetical protein
MVSYPEIVQISGRKRFHDHIHLFDERTKNAGIVGKIQILRDSQ